MFWPRPQPRPPITYLTSRDWELLTETLRLSDKIRKQAEAISTKAPTSDRVTNVKEQHT
jgi:hypothetical protein